MGAVSYEQLWSACGFVPRAMSPEQAAQLECVHGCRLMWVNETQQPAACAQADPVAYLTDKVFPAVGRVTLSLTSTWAILAGLHTEKGEGAFNEREAAIYMLALAALFPDLDVASDDGNTLAMARSLDTYQQTLALMAAGGVAV